MKMPAQHIIHYYNPSCKLFGTPSLITFVVKTSSRLIYSNVNFPSRFSSPYQRIKNINPLQFESDFPGIGYPPPLSEFSKYQRSQIPTSPRLRATFMSRRGKTDFPPFNHPKMLRIWNQKKKIFSALPW